MRPKRVCFVTGTRAEFGLMRSTLNAIESHPQLKLQIIATGMHLDRTRGNSLRAISREWKRLPIIPWKPQSSEAGNARNTGLAMAGIADALKGLKTDIVLVVGDRVEAFAAAAAGHISGCIVAHVHGGDRALGQVDDSLRHAITKLSHIHFPATDKSAARIRKLGEDPWRIQTVGSPGLDDLDAPAPVRRDRFALLLLHPTDANDSIERARAAMVLQAVRAIPFDRIVIIYPNNDPGSRGIVRCWEISARDPRIKRFRNLARPKFLGLLRDAAVLVGNSSSGVIEAASFGTPVVDVGPRQMGRDRSQNVTAVPYDASAIGAAIQHSWNEGRPRRFRGRNVYGSGGAGAKIANHLSAIDIDDRLRRKLIAY